LSASRFPRGFPAEEIRIDDSSGTTYGDFERNRISMIASVSKVLSAGVVLTMVDDGLLDLDRPVAEYLDWGDHHPDVTIRNIPSMMSGIPSISGSDTHDDPCVYDPATTLKECAQSVFRDESRSKPPGEEFRYSAGGWQLAGGVAEVVSKSSWADVVERQLLSPCGLCNTGFRAGDDSIFYPFDGDPSNLPATANPSLGGGAYSTVNDYSKVLLMHLRGGLCEQERVLSPEMVQLMQTGLGAGGREDARLERRSDQLRHGLVEVRGRARPAHRQRRLGRSRRPASPGGLGCDHDHRNRER
jgi:CubicO group peptidase (beta-lactamase class C family)